MAESEVMDFANVLAADIPLAVSNLNDIKTIVNQVNQMVRNLIDRVKNKEFPTAQGMSFLDVKNQLLLKYLMDLNCLLLKKVSGESIKASSSIERLVEIRTLLERMRPVEHKLRYQIDKLLKIATTGKFETTDPLQFKANPNNLISKVDNDASSEEEEDHRDKKSGVYVPPKLVPMKYDGDETAEQRSTKFADKVRRHALSSSALQGLKEEFMDTPVEIVESTANTSKQSIARERQERQEYEETYFTRLPFTRQERHSNRQQYSAKSLASELAGMGTLPETKRKSQGGKKKGGFKKRRKN
ncbi:neuroguidin-like [Daphnia pulicaria]|uniref:EOG090X0IJO n=2 Tax=Daphnia TaxID=6668 RepID=A0A4Y7MVD3_DAPPU|nr:neuroguidin-like [Daphnia pulicaria]SVE84618.1 EOG090X0IJO [Daphnia pulex]SVE85873.1 EOG090X0IJO [Daphnia pulicaria]